MDTPMHEGDPKDLLKTLQPMGRLSDVSDISRFRDLASRLWLSSLFSFPLYAHFLRLDLN